MNPTTTVQIYVGSQPHTPYLEKEEMVLELPISLKCPYCQDTTVDVRTWGSYVTKAGEVRRFRCKKCEKRLTLPKCLVGRKH